jgi:hypothetical protein
MQRDVIFQVIEFSHPFSWKAHSMLNIETRFAASQALNVVPNFMIWPSHPLHCNSHVYFSSVFLKDGERIHK